MPRVDELPQHDVTVDLSREDWLEVLAVLHRDRTKTRGRIQRRGDFRGAGRDLEEIRLRSLSAAIDVLETSCDCPNIIRMPCFAWWYVASAINGWLKGRHFVPNMGLHVDVLEHALEVIDDVIEEESECSTS